jgi:hypothetical protein
MYGGHGRRKFYLSEVDRIESARVKNLPKGEYTDAQTQAGFPKLARTFGFLYTLRYMEKVTPYKRHELLDWTVAEFYTNFALEAWEGNIIKRYRQILKDTKKEE